MIKICENCNGEFKTYKSGQKYCSKKCSGKANSLNKVNKECEYSGCTKIFDIYEDSKSNKVKKFCSTTCQNNWQKTYQLGENNGNYGRKNSWGTHSLEKRREISIKVKNSWENPERLEKHLEFLNRHRLSDGSFDWQDEFFRDRISKANIKRLMCEPSYGAYNNCKRGWYKSTKTDDDEYYHSSWEELKMVELDGDDNVNFWTKKHRHVIVYYDGNIRRRYLPDFLIDNGVESILEVKGHIKDERIFKLKCVAALEYFSSLKIDYRLDFMKNENKYGDLLYWFKNKKEEYYEKED